MPAQIIDGKAQAALWREETRRGVDAFVSVYGRPPCLHTILVGNDPASAIYVQGKLKAAADVGIAACVHKLEAAISQDELLAHIESLNTDDAVDGVLVQLPLPKGFDASKILSCLWPLKDVDGLTPTNAGLLMAQDAQALVPCTPMGCMRLIRAAGLADLSGLRAVVVGRSRLVGRPVAELLLQANATVTTAHSHTQDLPKLLQEADLVIAALGRPQAIQADWLKPKSVVIDVGINRLADGKICGDVDFSRACEVVSHITPVPGGVGPMTIAGLLHNTLKAAILRKSDKKLAFELKIA